jgi:PEP-CTERM motif
VVVSVKYSDWTKVVRTGVGYEVSVTFRAKNEMGGYVLAETPGPNTPQNDASGYGVSPSNNVYGTSAAQAFGYDEYLSFTLTPAAGQVVSLSQLQFGVSLPDEAAAPALEYSTNGTTFTEMDPTSTEGTGVSNGHQGAAEGIFNFSSVPALQGLTSETTVTFDLLLNSPSSNAGFQDGVFDDSYHDSHGLDIEVDGTAAAAPEPSTYALMFAGLGFVLVLVRNRRSLRA